MMMRRVTDCHFPRHQDFMRVVILLLFLGVTCTSMSRAPYLEVGLDQTLSMPEDSFVLKYFLVRM